MPYLLLLRPHNWIKNFFVFVPLFFAHKIFLPEQIAKTTYAFLAFCAIASCIYIINDIADRHNDALHPKKKNRPIASGAVAQAPAWIMSGFLFSLSWLVVYYYIPAIAPIILVYFALNIAYSLYFKRVPIVDILMVAGFYVLRVSAGALAISVPISGWLLLSTIFVSLFLVTAKRKAELFSGEKTRAVLHFYTPDFLNNLLQMSAIMMLVVYSIYAVTVVGSHLAVYSIFFVLLGVLRYLYLSYSSSKAEEPESIIFSDFWIFLSLVSWIAFMSLILYV